MIARLFGSFIIAAACTSIAHAQTEASIFVDGPDATTAPAGAAATTPVAATTVATRYAMAEVHVTDDGVPVRVNPAVAHLRERAAAMAPRMVGLGRENTEAWLRIEPAWRGQDELVQVQILVNLPDPAAKPAAKQMVDELIDALRQYIRNDFDAGLRRQIEPLERALKEAEKEHAEAQAKADQLRRELREISGRADVSGKNIGDAVTRLEEERQKLELDVMGKTARREALEKQIAQRAAQVEKQIENDAIAAELEKVVEARQAQVQRVQSLVAQNAASQSEVQEAVGRVAEARAKLLERRRDAAAEAGGEAMAALTRELLTLSVDLRELEARLEYIKTRLPRLRDALDLADELEEATAEAKRTRAVALDAQQERRKLQRRTARPAELSITEQRHYAQPQNPGNFRSNVQFEGDSEDQSLFGRGGWAPAAPATSPAPDGGF